jgi:DNA (cytosine-5)-methyltransferase 1
LQRCNPAAHTRSFFGEGEIKGMAKRKDKGEVAAIDLFCGLGGLTHGLIQAGIKVKLGVDIDPACKYPFIKNNDGAEFAMKSVSDVTPAQLKKAWGSSQYRLLAGCAPCQPFSSYSQGVDPAKDERWPLLLEFGRLVKGTRPDFVTMENVPRLKHQNVFAKFVKILKAERYHVWKDVVDCADYGVPQQRQRLVLLASLHGMPKLNGSKVKRHRTVRQAIGKLPQLRAGQSNEDDPLHQCSSLSATNTARIKVSKPGGTWRDWPAKLRAECHKRESGSGYVSVYGRMSWDEPSPTMTTQFYGYGNGRFGHPEQNRAISLREGAVLQSFPINYEFVEPGRPIHVKTVGRLIGNAVPVKIGYAIGKAILSQIASIENVEQK